MFSQRALFLRGAGIRNKPDTTTMKRVILTAIAAAIVLPMQAGIIVNDTWIDGTRTDPAASTYSENGTDVDGDGNIESAWFHAGSSGTSTTVINGSPGVTPGILRTTVGTGSTSLTTYFAPNASPVTLANIGDQIKLTWVFSPSGVVSTNTNAGQSFRVAIVDSPVQISPGPDGTPANNVYPGYAMFMNMSTTLNNGAPFQLYERNISAGTTGFLGNGGAWTALDNEESNSQPGYTDNETYTFTWMATLNGLGGLDIYSSMAGGTLGGDGLHEVTFTDATPNTLTFDMFGVRPSSSQTTAATIDTTSFRVEFNQVPEPTIAALMGIGLLGLVSRFRKTHS